MYRRQGLNLTQNTRTKLELGVAIIASNWQTNALKLAPGYLAMPIVTSARHDEGLQELLILLR